MLTLTLLLGGHWLLLQSVAWVGMAVSYAQTAPLHEALVNTFDGRHPCQLCKLVREGTAKEQKRDLLKPMLKLDLACFASELRLDPPAPRPRLAPAVQFFPSRSQAPPTPPPRRA